MKYWVTILFFGLLNLCSAQYFNNRYEFEGQPDNAKTILEVPDGYVVSGSSRDSSSLTSIGIIKLDYDGNEVWKKMHPPPLYHGFFTGNQGAFISVSGGGL
jgi:hypothetical protein